MSYDTDFYGNVLDVIRGRKPLSAIEYGLRKTENNYPAQALNLRYIENHDMDRFINQFSIRKTKLAATMLFTLPGTPLILYGQEFGLHEKLPDMDWSRADDDYFDFYRKLILLRRNFSCLRRGELIKIHTNHADKVYAFLRQDEVSTFLILLNFAETSMACQLLLPEQIQPIKKKIILDEMFSGDVKQLEKIDTNVIQLNLQAESAYVYKLTD
jgi:glycosidase